MSLFLPSHFPSFHQFSPFSSSRSLQISCASALHLVFVCVLFKIGFHTPFAFNCQVADGSCEENWLDIRAMLALLTSAFA